MKKIIKIPDIDFIQNIAEHIQNTSSNSEIEEGLRLILSSHKLLSYQIKENKKLWRGRMLDKNAEFRTFPEVHYPPERHAKLGRINNKGESILYVSGSQMTALSELRARPGDRLQLVAYKTTRPLNTFSFGEYQRIHLNGKGQILADEHCRIIGKILSDMGYEAALSFIYMDATLSLLMQDSTRDDYIYPRTISKIIFEEYSEIDAIHYQSVARNGAMNFAIRKKSADTKLSFIGTSPISITKDYGHGLFRFKEEKISTEVDKFGNFIW